MYLTATMYLTDYEFGPKVAAFLTPYYISLALMNGIAAFYLWRSNQLKTWFKIGSWPVTNAIVWSVVGLGFACLAGFSGNGNIDQMPGLSEGIRNLVDQSTGPVIYTIGTTLALVVMFVFRRFFVNPTVAWALLNASLLFLGLSMVDMDFYAIVAKPDNVPIVMLVYLLAFFTWLATYRAVINDDLKEQGKPNLEEQNNEKILVWPDLVYTELICMLALTAFLIVWAIFLQAPLEEPASSVKTPNPSKAPWYFLGLQEMLVYFDPWMAGVVLPSLIVVGLMAIPYLDFNKAGNGYYTIKERKFSYIVWQIGFLELWITLIILGTLLRGPNWNFFGPYEYWDAHKVEALNNVDLSAIFWEKTGPIWTSIGVTLGTDPMPAGIGTAEKIARIVYRELPGILILGFYFAVLPAILGVTVMRGYLKKMGLVRFMTMATLLLFMASLPLKMLARWIFNLKYVVAIPEYLLNF